MSSWFMVCKYCFAGVQAKQPSRRKKGFMATTPKPPWTHTYRRVASPNEDGAALVPERPPRVARLGPLRAQHPLHDWQVRLHELRLSRREKYRIGSGRSQGLGVKSGTNLYIAYYGAAPTLPEDARQIRHPSVQIPVGDLHVCEDGAVQRGGQVVLFGSQLLKETWKRVYGYLSSETSFGICSSIHQICLCLSSLRQPPLQRAQDHVERGVPDAVRLRPEAGLGGVVQRLVQLLGRQGEDSPARVKRSNLARRPN